MKSSAPIALGSAIYLALLVIPANAQATRTWVSGVGADTNSCSRTAPCLTFAGAIAKTPANGIIVCLDPGEFDAGFSAVTITQSITIDCEETTGSFLAPGGNGINVAGSGIVVNLRGLAIGGLGTGLVGINVTQAATVYIRKSVIYGFQSGVATGISFSGGGTLVVNDTVVHANGTGIALNGSGGNVNMTLRDVIVHSNAANGISITTSGSSAGATIDHSTLAFNGGAGLNVNGSAAIAMIGNSTVTGNATGVAVPSGTLYSFKENQIAGNSADGTPITSFPGPGGPLQ
jgi:hypothetical protein